MQELRNSPYQSIAQFLQSYLEKYGANNQFNEWYTYSVLPPGKLFRPLLAYHYLVDLNPHFFDSHKNCQNFYLLATGLEVHHAYSLVHDDLPAMDNDSLRRGRPTMHKAFGEWQAILTGDGLLNLSYQAWSHINSLQTAQIIKIFSRLLGPKGLIHGQALDLSQKMTETWSNLILTHELKTSRLIQAALLGAVLVNSSGQLHTGQLKKAYRLGQSLGIAFQLLDDLNELNVHKHELSKHELDVNPWIHFQDECLKHLPYHLRRLQNLTDFPNTKTFINEYLKTSLGNVEKNKIYLKEYADLKRIENSILDFL